MAKRDQVRTFGKRCRLFLTFEHDEPSFFWHSNLSCLIISDIGILNLTLEIEWSSRWWNNDRKMTEKSGTVGHARTNIFNIRMTEIRIAESSAKKFLSFELKFLTFEHRNFYHSYFWHSNFGQFFFWHSKLTLSDNPRVISAGLQRMRTLELRAKKHEKYAYKHTYKHNL